MNKTNKYSSNTWFLSFISSAAIASFVYKSLPAIAVLPIDNLKLNKVVPALISLTFELCTPRLFIFSFVSLMIFPFISEIDTHKCSAF